MGGWPPGGPMPPQQPPPTEQTNTLATLSVVFAVVFAPVGAVLGHLALSEIKKRPQRGHTRALVGVTLSYVLIVIAVLGLVVWAVLPARTSTSSTTTTTPHPISGDSIKQILLNGTELTALLHQPFETTAKYPRYGGVDAMPDRFPSETSASPHDCVGAMALTEKSIYQSAGVAKFADESWFAPLPNHVRVVAVTEAVVALPNPADAEDLFNKFSEQWKRCEGRTVTTTGHRLPVPNAGDPTFEITDVRVDESVLAATVIEGQTGKSLQDPRARAVGISENCLVEVDISFFTVELEQRQGSAEPETSGIDVARAMLDKARKLS
ncbi:sensor domain-containing protein [Mycobacterium sp. pUA109]|uniref:sensor domain-containing protein n=1 Tax=Mycobacterium sp. pUA109 TaxID=3238982 RepID=UPI00351B9CA9